jgi:hypothetical protein
MLKIVGQVDWMEKISIPIYTFDREAIVAAAGVSCL